jgi:putative FmdB family regulatory protein
MPLYDCRCTECGHRFEESRSMIARDEPYECPKCGGEARRVFNTPPALPWTPVASESGRKFHTERLREGC